MTGEAQMATTTHGKDGSLREFATSCPERQAIVMANMRSRIEAQKASQAEQPQAKVTPADYDPAMS